MVALTDLTDSHQWNHRLSQAHMSWLQHTIALLVPELHSPVQSPEICPSLIQSSSSTLTLKFSKFRSNSSSKSPKIHLGCPSQPHGHLFFHN